MGDGIDPPNHKGFLYRVRYALRLRISAKIFIYFLGVALIPLIVLSIILVNVAHSQLSRDASAKQMAIANDLSHRVDNYFANDLNPLAFVARLYSTHTLSDDQMNQSLIALFNQNSTLEQITLLTPSGGNLTLTMSGGIVKTTKSGSGPAVSSALAFLQNKQFFSSVGRDDNNYPQVAVGVPILKKYGAPSTGLFASESGPTSNISGAVVGYYNVSDLWASVLSTTIGKGGYAYVVDTAGSLVAHPDKQFTDSHRQVGSVQAVQEFLHGNNVSTHETTSETGQDVISTVHKSLNGWAVVVEEPVSSINADINSYLQLATIVDLIVMFLTIIAGVFFSRQLINPIRQLSIGARRMEHGIFDHKIEVKTKDEFRELAGSFNSMALSIKKLISDLQANNLRLRIEQIKLNNIISSVSDGVIAVNSKGEILSVNPPAAVLVHQSPKNLEGKRLMDEFAWEHDEKRFMPDLEQGGIYHYADLMLKRGDGIVYLDLIVAVLSHQDSDVAAIITIQDKTESRELSFMKLDFVAIAAHELRTPLTVVRGYLDMLNTGSAVRELSIFNLENLSKATVGADQLRELINKLLNIARIERGDMEIFPEKLNLSKLVADNVDEHKSAAAQREQVIGFNSSSNSIVYAPADSASIVEVLNNLIGNAIKYTGKGGRIRVNLIVNGGTVRVEVKDNGPGVPDDLRDRLFTKFYRAERSLIAGTRGTGLGLFISKTIIELQDGTIGIEPDRGDGSTFYFTLPIYNAARDDELIAKKTSGGIRGWFKKRPTS